MKRVQLTVHGVEAYRWIYARQSERRYNAARDRLGVVAPSYRVLSLVDKMGERPTRVAYAARIGGGSIVCLDEDGSKPVTLPTCAEGEIFGSNLNEEDRTKPFDFGPKVGIRFAHRYELLSGVIERYEPLTEVEREQRRIKREAAKRKRMDAAWRRSHPLFADIADIEVST